MMALAFSGFLIGTSLIVIPIVLHLLKLKPRVPQAYPALMFLYATVARRQSRNRLRKFIILLLRCLVFSLIALAFAWPYLADIAQEPEEASVILWDSSFSMQEESVGSYLNDEAINVLSIANNKYPMAVGAVTESVKWSGDFSGNSGKLTQWFKNNRKSYGSSSFREAIRQADSKLKNISAKKKTIIIITDRQLLPWESVALKRPLSPGTKLKIIMPPKRKLIKNTAITMVKFQSKYFYSKQKLNLKMNFQNFNSEAVSANLVIYFDNKRIKGKKITLPPNSVISEHVQLIAPAGTPRPLAGTVELRADNDNLRIDNVHYFSINPIAKPKIFLTPLIGGSKVDFIKTALMPAKPQGEKINAEFCDLIPDTKFDKFKDASLLLLQDLKVFGDDFIKKIDKYLDAGGNVVIVWQNSAETKKMLKHFDISVVKKQNKGVQRFEMLDFEHSVFKDYLKVRAGAWFDILFFDAPTLKFPAKTKILAYFDKQIPAITECRYKNGKVFVVASELDRKHTNWPTFGSFLPFWRELLLYSERKEQRAYSLRVNGGKVLWKQKVKVSPVDMPKTKAKSFLQLDIPGNFMVKSKTKNMIYSVNVPEKESAVTLLPSNYDYQKLVSNKKVNTKEIVKAKQKNKLKFMQHAKSYWWILLLLAFALSFLEILLANRTAL
jgi:aerotolerance regulator-like protein